MSMLGIAQVPVPFAHSQFFVHIQGGAQFQLMDYAQFNQLIGEFTLGEDTFGRLSYVNDMTSISIFATGGWFLGKSDSGFLLDADQNSDTIMDQNLYEIKTINLGMF